MSNRNNGAASVLTDEVDGLVLEKENRELASRQVRQINDTLRKVRRISRESQKEMQRPVLEESSASVATPVVALSTPVHEVVLPPRKRDARRERDDSTDKFLIPEPALASPVTEVFRKAFEMFERECTQFRYSRVENSPVTRTWKLM